MEDASVWISIVHAWITYRLVSQGSYPRDSRTYLSGQTPEVHALLAAML
ncbi:hypothetical protein GMOD_00000060 [Pyrenophora seminiperda CCB06]|uniref:Uncharacterized protein n=1 Tax=Pyrenophora seminiperda CCB06 TaxID=1302712 RepID=A0A3M7M6C3_9PLEO|nr:hypothetical protein GMOD_00000060 [Pyrenophora seminiperda CCB06]